MRGTRGGDSWMAIGTMLVLSVAVFSPTVALEAQQTLRPTLRKVEVRSRVPVSGGIRVGLLVQLDGRIVPGETAVYVTIPAASETLPPYTSVCLEVSSQDGRYSGRFGYPPPETPGIVRLQLEAEDLETLRSYSAGRIALLASLSNDCEREEPSTFLVARWRQPAPTSADRTSLLLNSRVPTFVVRQGTAAEELRCAPVGDDAVAFNLRCELPAAWLGGTTALVVQQRRGRSVSGIPMTVYGR